MKTFKNLSIGDIIYLIKNGNDGKPYIEQIKVYSMQLSKNDLLINKRDGNYNAYYDLELPLIKLNNISYIVLRDKRPEKIYTISEKAVSRYMVKIGLNLIDKCEKEIEKLEEKIRETRINYWDYLQFLK
jgi:hypothetical protein